MVPRLYAGVFFVYDTWIQGLPIAAFDTNRKE